MKNVFFFCVVLFFVLGSPLEKREQALAITTSSTTCIYKYNAANGNPYGYPCPVPTFAPIVNGMTGVGAYNLTESVGINIHLNYGNYANYPYIQAVLVAARIHHVRDGMQPFETAVWETNEYNSLGAAGIKADLIVNHNEPIGEVIEDMLLINPGVVEAIENSNELDICCNLANWASLDRWQQSNIVWPVRNIVFPIALTYGPATGNSSYASIGDLSSYEDFGNVHDYEGGFPPENTGFGGPSYCGFIYGQLITDICNAQQASKTRPIIATEFGYEINPYQQNGSIEAVQGTFILRQILYHQILGVPKSYIYELDDSNGQTYGLLRSDGSQRPSYAQIAGFQNILADTAPISNCVVPVTVNTSGVMALGVCKTTGEYDLILWQPAVSYNTNTLIQNVFGPISTPVTLNAGFSPSSVTQWSFANGSWSNAPASTSGIPVTDVPTIISMNGPPSPTPMPALPTAPPTPVPTPTPVYVPTPTPAPTLTPTSVSLAQTATAQIPSNTVQTWQQFPSVVPYGDLVVSYFALSQYSATRRVILAPGGFSVIDPLEVYPASPPVNSNEIGLATWQGYVTNQAGIGPSIEWIASGGDTGAWGSYDFNGVDSSNPIATFAASENFFKSSTCPTVTVPRPGSMVICGIATKQGTSSNNGIAVPSGFGSSWIMDAHSVGLFNSFYGFHLAANTTTVNQIIPAFSVMLSNTNYAPWVAETIVIQPPL